MQNRKPRTAEKPTANGNALDLKSLYHAHSPCPNQCTSTVVQEIHAPLSLVWSVLRRFQDPQRYKLFVRSCDLVSGNGGVGSVREVTVVSGMPAGRSTERLDRLDDDQHVIEYSIIGGDHKLMNYQSTMTVHEDGGGKRTVVIESYAVDIPADSCGEDTRLFADTIIGFNLKTLAKISEEMAG